MREHPAESQREWTPGIVTAVHPDTWEVDVQPLHSTSGTVRRAKVIGHYLPEVHTAERQSKVIFGRLDALQQAPIAIPIHNTMIPPADKPNFVQWLELLDFRITINRSGELEIRQTADGEVIASFRIHNGNLTVDVANDVTVTNAAVNATGDVEVEAQGNVDVEAVAGNVDVQAGGNASVQATGAVTISGAAVRMPAIARDGDLCGGAIIATATKTKVNGLAPARIGDLVAPHGDHVGAKMLTGSTTVIVEGKGVCRVGDAADCGHTIEEGDASGDTFAG